MRKSFFLLFILIPAIAVAQKKRSLGTDDYVRAMKDATDVMVNDVTSPVAASRYYAYISLAANETARRFNGRQLNPCKQMKGYAAPEIPRETLEKADAALAIILSVYSSGARFLPSGVMLKKKSDSLLQVAAKIQIKKDRVAATVDVVNAVVQSIAAYASGDGFVKLTARKRFTPSAGDEYWQPTPPGFMSAIEPHWGQLRPFIIDSASQFTIDPPLKYSKDSTSEFYKQMMEVYVLGKNRTVDQTNSAMFWDCNPFALQQVGHLEFGLKKISPGGHWIGITGIACKKAKTDLLRATYIHALISVSMADAFISCWHTKYKYNRVRPETAIKRMVDRTWNPLLQTPPFPEYSSGHSVVSTAAAIVLTEIFGDGFAFNDNTETEFGLPVRRFVSFKAAAEEAAMSRLYGGIHFRDAIENGQQEGSLVARYILQQVPKLEALRH